MVISKKAFTMIELIFVIVILGVLVAIAVPKLSATRDDAKISMIAQNIMFGVEEIASYAMATSKTEDNLSLMSNGIKSLAASGDAILSSKKAVIKMGADNSCVTVKIVTGLNDDNVTITINNTTTDSLCQSLQSAIDATKYPIKLRGINVIY